MRKMIYLMLALLMLSAASANAQVTIGSDKEPPAYSLLELDAGSNKGGLHLPRLTTAERDALSLNADAAGLLIFNISTNCLDIWTGSTWKSQCESILPGGANPSTPASFEENGRYALYGKILFDVNNGTVLDYPAPYNSYPADYPHTCDFNLEPETTTTSVYTLKSSPENSYTFSSAQFVVDDPAKLLASYSTNSSAGTVTLTFKSLTAVQDSVDNAGRTNAKKITITAFFLDNRGSKKKVELVVRVQNAPVGCSVRKVDDPASSSPTVSGWLTFMCYNLGADPDYGDPAAQKEYVPNPNTSNSTDRTVYGDHYQWGRVGDGHQRRDLSIENVWPIDHSGVTSGFTEDPVPNDAANINTTTGQVLETDARFGKFIRRSSGNLDWIAGGTGVAVYIDRWNAGPETAPQKAPADPCPEGWRIPTHTEWASIYGTTVNCSGSDTCHTKAKVNKWTPDFAAPSGNSATPGVSLTPSKEATGTADYTDISPTLFLPGGDDRNRDHATIDGWGAFFWSSTVDVSNSIHDYALRCADKDVYPSFSTNRSNARSVRCVAK